MIINGDYPKEEYNESKMDPNRVGLDVDAVSIGGFGSDDEDAG
jgi:hypothetical protein